MDHERPEEAQRWTMAEITTRQGEWALGKWRMDSLLGAGGMCAVYAATHRSNGKRAAVKVLHPELVQIPEVVSRFAREGLAANTGQCTNVGAGFARRACRQRG